MRNKYLNGQKVLVWRYGKNWDDDYQAPGTIVSFNIVSLVGYVITYCIKLDNGELLSDVPQGEITRND